MKTQSSPIHKLRSCLKGLGATAAFVLFLGGGSPVSAQSPVGTWDCVVSGGRQGTVHLRFAADFTLEGQIIHFSSAALRKTPSPNPRGVGSESRTPGDDSGGSSSSATNEFGGANLVGRWSLDGRRVVGYMTEETTDDTNELGFVAVVRSGANPRLTFKASAEKGGYVLRGVMNVPLASLNGDHIGLGRRNGVIYTEFLTLADSAIFTTTGANMYDVVGTGANYDLSGFAMRLRQGRLGLYLERVNGTNPVEKITVVTGPIKNGKAQLKGTDGGRISYKLLQQAPLAE